MFIFEQLTFLHQTLTRNLKIIRPQSKNNFHGYMFFSALFGGLYLKNKVLVHFCAFLCATSTFEYDFLETSTTLGAKVFEYSLESNLWRHIGKKKYFGDIWWSSLSLCIISVVEFNLNSSRKFHNKLNVNHKFQILKNVAPKIRSFAFPTYSSLIMSLGKYSGRCSNWWRSTTYDWFVHL